MKNNLSWTSLSLAVGSCAQGMLWRIATSGQKYSDPGIVTSAAKQIDHFLQGRIHKGGLCRREQALDVIEQRKSGAINFQEQALEAENRG